MAFLVELWLPILLSAAAVFIVSALFHMVLPLHKGEYRGLSDEDGLLAALRERNVTRGEYWFPFAAMKDMGDPDVVARYRQGPVGVITVMDNGPPAMLKGLVQWFLFSVVVSVFCAYIGSFALGVGADYMTAFRLTGTVAALAYGVSHVPDSIWKGKPWAMTRRYVFEGLVYGLVTAGVFGWLWPTGV